MALRFILSHSSERILIWRSCGTKKFSSYHGRLQTSSPIYFIRGISVGKLDSFLLDFASVSDERGPGSVINDYL